MQVLKSINRICLSCKNFIPDNANNKFGLCKAFFFIDRKNKTIGYEKTIHVRMDENKCGIAANLYIPKKDIK
jgi:hypothetical protein